MRKNYYTNNMQRRQKREEPVQAERICDADGCLYPGLHKAPKSGGNIRKDYYLFCMDHVREFNKSYNFFSNMDDDDVMLYMKDAVTGHRPTWRMGDGPAWGEVNLEDDLLQFMHGNVRKQKRSHPLLPEPVRDALELMELDDPVDIPTLKQYYKRLVKRYHPDVNKDEGAEGLFKQVTHAYHVLKAHYQTVG